MEKCMKCKKFGVYERASLNPEKIIKVFKSSNNTTETYHVKCYYHNLYLQEKNKFKQSVSRQELPYIFSMVTLLNRAISSICYSWSHP